MERTIQPKQGEIWMVRFDPVMGDEIGKARPAVVLSNAEAGRLDLCFVCPITDWKDRYERYPWFTFLEPSRQNGLAKPSGADAFQCKSISLLRFLECRGRIEDDQFTDIVDRLNFCLRRL
jgi:mRNA interferase MazF